jgi:hypothetical protein
LLAAARRASSSSLGWTSRLSPHFYNDHDDVDAAMAGIV